jgi:hypothetical protein
MSQETPERKTIKVAGLDRVILPPVMAQWRNIPLQINLASIMHVAMQCDSDITPELLWRTRGGIDAKNPDQKAATEVSERIYNLIETSAIKEPLNDFLSRSVKKLDFLAINGIDAFHKVYMDRDILSIVGFPRSGTTYLLTQLCEKHGIPWQRLCIDMLMDTIPADSVKHDVSMLNPGVQVAFDMCQWLTWAIECQPQAPTILIRKSVTDWMIADWMRTFFGDRAHFVHVVRDPTFTMKSYAKHYQIDEDEAVSPPSWLNLCRRANVLHDEEAWSTMTFAQRFRALWKASIVLSSCIPPHQIDFVAYNDIDTYVGNQDGNLRKDKGEAKSKYTQANMCLDEVGHMLWSDTFQVVEDA